MKYQRHEVDDDGWTGWIQPRHEAYKLACCDCGLVHVLQFRVVKDALVIDANDTTDGLVVFRARRDERATGQKRRRK